LKSLTQDQNAAVIREEILEALKEHIGEDLRQEEDDLTFVVIRPHYATSLAN
jgi:serine phosphatase RsbU (regulator of sigma subunit)